ncbi:LCP family glycopolymer transferase [Isobaculum melis]|uniref:Cell envelope-related function transcriptional attenuator common domain-containing protein n=1 Tax=Isobaculum melis TaxID=142588 RepID=A0A1H9QQC2_9LACT|nr:LCP family protein [Isobaculum melis]SER61933.1 cell envelope-related function transcriptional attenuator common domain-containing protein [Isobaculum melis]
MMRSNRTRKKYKRRRIIFTVLLLVVVALGIYVAKVALSAKQMLDDIKGEDITSTLRDGKPDLGKKQPFSVLLLGVDEREDDVGRSDTIIVVTVNPETRSTKMVSIPRDTLIYLPERQMDDKANAAYAFGGIQMAHEAIENFLGIPIDYYAKINMEGMEDLVDAVGGVTVNSPFEFDLDGYVFPAGEQKLDGKEALAYVRMRKEDPEGDFGRQKRQREVIQAVINKTLSASSLTNFDKIFKAVGDNVETNFTASELTTVADKYRSAADTIEDLSFDGIDDLQYISTYDQEVYVWVPDEDSVAQLQQQLKEHLNMN